MSTINILSKDDLNEAKKKPQYIAALSVCLGSLCTGTVLGWSGNITNDLQRGNFNNIEIDDDSLGWIGSLANIGALFSCLVVGALCEYFGRKRAMLLLIIPYTLGWLLIIFAQNVSMMYIGRITGGFAGGGFCISAPLYVSEISQKNIRGSLATMSELLLTTGILIAYTLGYFFSAKTTTIVLAVFPLVFGVIFLTQPETPYYLLKKDQEEEAIRSLQKLRGKNYDTSEELKQMVADIEEDKANELPLLQSFKKIETKKATFVSLGLMFFQQACGVNAVIFYTSNIFSAAGIDSNTLSPEMSTIIVGIAQILANVISALSIDRLGRRTLLTISGLFMAIPEVFLGIYFTLQDHKLASQSTLTTLGFLPVLCLCVFIISAEVGYGPVAWIISVEICPAELRNVLPSGSGAFNWLISFLVTKFYLNMKNGLGGDVTFYIFAGISFLGAAFPAIFVPETKGKSFVEIQRALRGE